MKPIDVTNNVRELWRLIAEIGISNLLTDALIQSIPQILRKYQIKCERMPLTVSLIKTFGDFYLVWYPNHQGWSGSDKPFMIKDYNKAVRLEKTDNIRIVVFRDTKLRKSIIVDGSHRATALYQHPCEVDGDLYIFSSPIMRYLTIKDFFNLFIR